MPVEQIINMRLFLADTNIKVPVRKNKRKLYKPR